MIIEITVEHAWRVPRFSSDRPPEGVFSLSRLRGTRTMRENGIARYCGEIITRPCSTLAESVDGSTIPSTLEDAMEMLEDNERRFHGRVDPR